MRKTKFWNLKTFRVLSRDNLWNCSSGEQKLSNLTDDLPCGVDSLSRRGRLKRRVNSFIASLKKNYFWLLRAFSSCTEQTLLFVQCAGSSLRRLLSCWSTSSRLADFSNGGTQAYWLHGRKSLPRPGIKPVSPALAGRLFSTGPSGKSASWFNLK